MYSINEGVILLGYMTDGEQPADKGIKVNNFDRWYKVGPAALACACLARLPCSSST